MELSYETKDSEMAAKGEDPTEHTEGSIGPVEITVASPENNNKKGLPTMVEEDLSPGRRCARLVLAFLVLAGAIGGCVAVLVVLKQNKHPEYIREDSADSTLITTEAPISTEPPIAMFCPRDVQTCLDGTFVGRDKDNNCEFFPCPELPPVEEEEEEVVEEPELQLPEGQCSEGINPREIKMCTDLTTVTRSGPNCEFAPCPTGACMLESQECADGSTVGRDPENNCEFAVCPEVVQGQCPEGINPREIKLCPDFTTVTRSGPNCEFAPCP